MRKRDDTKVNSEFFKISDVRYLKPFLAGVLRTVFLFGKTKEFPNL